MHFGSFLEAIIAVGKNKGNKVDNALMFTDYREEVTEWVRFFDNRPVSFCHVIPTAFIYDYTTSAFTYFSPSVAHLMGVSSEYFLETNGMVRFIDLINPNDFKVYNEHIFPKEMSMLHDASLTESRDLVFSTTFRLNKAVADTRCLLMKKGYIYSDSEKHPHYEFGILTDISPIKKELSMTHIIEKFQEDQDCAYYTRIHSEVYYPDMVGSTLTPREKEILNNLSLGIRRKEVGVRLFISDNTVANHIKTILRKTNSKNIREAIAICKMNGII